MALTAGLMIAPQLGVGVFVLLLSVGHIGTAVPLMLIWMVIDRANPGERPSRRAVLTPVLVCLLLTWVLVADPLVLVVGIVPLVAVCAVRVVRAVWTSPARATAGPPCRRAGTRCPSPPRRSSPTAWPRLVNRLLRARGGFVLHPLGYQLAPVHTWPKHAWVTGEGLLALFGAKPQGPAAEMAFALLHLAGVALVAWAMWRVARRFFSWPDLISQVLLVAMVLNVLVYVPSTLANATDLNAREFAVVLPFGAVLAGRVLAEPLATRWRGGELGLFSWLRGARWRAGLASAVAAGYLASLGYAAAQPPAPPANEQLATFLAAHHLTYGVSGYWQSSIVTVDSDGAVMVRAVWADTLRPYPWEAKASWYDPRSNRATFLVTDSQPGFFNYFQPSPAVLARYGPARSAPTTSAPTRCSSGTRTCSPDPAEPAGSGPGCRLPAPGPRLLPDPEHQVLLTKHAPQRGNPKVDPRQRGRRGNPAAEGIGQEPRDNGGDLKAGRVQVLDHRHVGQRERMVGAVEILACAVPEVRAEDGKRPTGFHRCVELGEYRAYRVLAG